MKIAFERKIFTGAKKENAAQNMATEIADANKSQETARQEYDYYKNNGILFEAVDVFILLPQDQFTVTKEKLTQETWIIMDELNNQTQKSFIISANNEIYGKIGIENKNGKNYLTMEYFNIFDKILEKTVNLKSIYTVKSRDLGKPEIINEIETWETDSCTNEILEFNDEEGIRKSEEPSLRLYETIEQLANEMPEKEFEKIKKLRTNPFYDTAKNEYDE